jgi:hypothetical protein
LEVGGSTVGLLLQVRRRLLSLLLASSDESLSLLEDVANETASLGNVTLGLTSVDRLRGVVGGLLGLVGGTTDEAAETREVSRSSRKAGKSGSRRERTIKKGKVGQNGRRKKGEAKEGKADARSRLVDDVGSKVPSLVDQATERVGGLGSVLVALSGNVLRTSVLAETSKTLGVVKGSLWKKCGVSAALREKS